MSYAGQQDMIDRFGSAELLEVADRDGDLVIDAAVMADALSDADETINGYVASRYDLPFSTVPPLLVRIAADIARYFLHKDGPTEVVAENYKQALRALKDIAAGTVVLEVAGAATPESIGGVTHSAPARVFDATTLEDY